MAGYWQIYLLIMPGLLFFVVFKIGPMWGLQFAFYDYNIFGGSANSEFVGLGNFANLIKNDTFFMMLRNTMAISLINLIFYYKIEWVPEADYSKNKT